MPGVRCAVYSGCTAVRWTLTHFPASRDLGAALAVAGRSAAPPPSSRPPAALGKFGEFGHLLHTAPPPLLGAPPPTPCLPPQTCCLVPGGSRAPARDTFSAVAQSCPELVGDVGMSGACRDMSSHLTKVETWDNMCTLTGDMWSPAAPPHHSGRYYGSVSAEPDDNKNLGSSCLCFTRVLFSISECHTATHFLSPGQNWPHLQRGRNALSNTQMRWQAVRVCDGTDKS